MELKLLKFSAKWCGPCKLYAPTVKKVVEKFPEIELVEIDIDDDIDYAVGYSIRSVPTTILILKKEDGIPAVTLGTLIGNVRESELEIFLKEHLPDGW